MPERVHLIQIHLPSSWSLRQVTQPKSMMKIKLLWFPSVAEPSSNSGKTRRCGAELHHLHWISSVRHVHIHQLDRLRVSAVSLTA